MAAPSQESLFRTENSDIPLLAEVIIPVALPQNYTWSVPASMRDQVQIGIRVEVNLGARRRYAGIIKRLHTDKPDFKPKPIIQVLDDHPIVTETQLIFWTWIAQYYLCTEGEVMSAALPTNFKLSSETWLRLLPTYGEDFTALEDAEYLLAEALSIKKQLRISEAQLILQNKQVYSIIHRLVELGIAELVESLQEKYASRLDTFISLHPTYQDETTLADLLNGGLRAPKQLELLLAYLDLKKDNDFITRATLLKRASSTAAPLQALIEKEILIAEKRSVGRITRPEAFVKLDFTLSSYQETALQSIRSQWNQQDVCLIRGVTGSGKTHLYIQLIADAIQQGRQVLYLLPEIALTSQIIRRLQQHFGGGVGVYHSRFSGNERVEIWNEVRSGKIRVMLGARSALFLPFTDLGLIICDEEHDASYKQQDPAPRYHARDAAIYLAARHEAKVLLGSATPSLESFYHAQQGKYGYVELTQRFGAGELPSLQVIDTRAILKEDRTRVSMTPPLMKRMEEVLAQKRQIILFQNRRGYSPYQLCILCGWIPQCEHCDVSLTYHKKSNQLRCHYCGSSYPLVQRCHACGHDQFGQRSFGTERIEEQLQLHFPKARIARMDVDTVKGKQAHDQLIQQFEAGEVDILVGTQMVVKGLDFDRVDLVGILDADGLMHFADFRASERAFQLMEQVSGRAGRKQANGQVLVQTSDPEHPILKWVAAHDYIGFYEAELKKRQAFGYPPFSRMIRVLFRYKQQSVVEQAAQAWAKAMGATWQARMIGPAEPMIARIRDQFRMEVWLKLPRSAKSIAEAKGKIISSIYQFRKEKSLARVDVVIDVDPVS
ncbi:MAG: primosomal protein [Bacteroidota bacterium]|jgi:primosomal protein N' (replication factor Y)